MDAAGGNAKKCGTERNWAAGPPITPPARSGFVESSARRCRAELVLQGGEYYIQARVRDDHGDEEKPEAKDDNVFLQIVLMHA